MAARSLPHNLDAEASILGGILRDPTLLGSVDALEVDDFFDMKHRVVFGAIRNLTAASKPIDIVTLADEIERVGKTAATGGIGFLGELVLNVPTAENVVAYAKIIRGKTLVRKVAIGAADLLARAERWQDEPDELVAQARKDLDDLSRLHVEATEPVRLISVGGALEMLSGLADAPIYETPFATLNAALGFGGMLGTQVYTLAAGTGRGKTSFVGEVAAYQAERTDVIVASWEMAPGYFVARQAAGRLGVHSNQIIRGEISAREVMATLPHARLWFLHKPTLRQLRAAVGKLKARSGVAPLVIVDYMQKLAAEVMRSQTRPDPRTATTEASAELCDIAESYACPVLAVSATSRASSKRTVDARKVAPYELVDVSRESGDVEYDGAGLIVLSLSSDFDGDERIGTITVAKARFGRELHIDARFDGRRGTWRDLGEVDALTPTSGAAAAAGTAARTATNGKILRALFGNPAKSKSEIFRRTGGSKTSVFRAVDELIAAGDLAYAGTAIDLTEQGKGSIGV